MNSTDNKITITWDRGIGGMEATARLDAWSRATCEYRYYPAMKGEVERRLRIHFKRFIHGDVLDKFKELHTSLADLRMHISHHSHDYFSKVEQQLKDIENLLRE